MSNNGWMPIDSAPKDGSRIEFKNDENGRTDVGHWESWEGDEQWKVDMRPDFCKDWNGEWCTDFGEGDMTHWRYIETTGEDA